jgi:hypothetical protein
MGISIFPSQGNGFTLQRVITASGEQDLGGPRNCFFLLSGGGGGGAGGMGSTASGPGGAGAGAVGMNIMLNQFHATIGAGGTAGTAGNAGTSGGNSALTIGGGMSYTGTYASTGNNLRASQQVVAMGGGGANNSGGLAGGALASISVTNRTGFYAYGSAGSSGGNNAQVSRTTLVGAHRTVEGDANGMAYAASQNGFIHNGNSNWYNFGATSSNPSRSGNNFSNFLAAPGPKNQYSLVPENTSFAVMQSSISQNNTGDNLGVAPGGTGANANISSPAARGGTGYLTGGGGAGGISGSSYTGAAGGGTGLYNGGLGGTSGGGGGGGAGISGAGTDGAAPVSTTGGIGGAGGFGGGGGGGGGYGSSTGGAGGKGGDGALLIFY